MQRKYFHGTIYMSPLLQFYLQWGKVTDKKVHYSFQPILALHLLYFVTPVPRMSLLNIFLIGFYAEI